jgi:CubicO group peptidase (beta-lactamase class C family)
LGNFLPAGADSQTARWPTKGWERSAPEEQGMDSQKLAEAIQFIKGKDPNVHSFLVIRNGYLVADAVFDPFTIDSKHDIASVSKSVTSTVVGVALTKKLIKSLDQAVLDFFSDRTIANLDVAKKSMTIKNFLTMRSGLTCINRPTEVTLFRMMNSPDWVQYMLDLPMAAKPGTEFVYNSGGVHLLSAIIGKAAGTNSLEFAKANLFGPLGITDIVWPEGPQGNSMGWGTIRMKPHDMAKIGYLYLNMGLWEGKRILSAEFVDKATHKPDELMTAEYGYLWWLQPHGGYAARGRGGQFIFVDPDRNLVVVFTGGGGRVPEKVMRDYVRPAILSDGKSPANPEGVLQLQDAISQASQAPPANPGSLKPLPATADRISGKAYQLAPNPFGLLGMTLTFVSQAEATLRLEMALDTDRNPEFKLGLDGLPRITPARYGLPATGKAKWTSEKDCVIDINELGNINRFRITITFEEDTVSGKVQEFTGLGSMTFKGKMKQ